MSAKYTKSNFSNQTGTDYMAALDANAEVCFRTAAAFTPSQAGTPDMTVRVEAGALLSGGTLIEIAAQNTSIITAPTASSRIDRVVISRATGAVSVITGAEGYCPIAPALTADVLPVAQVALSAGQTSITDADITDERVCGGSGDMLRANNLSDLADAASARANLGLGSAAVLNVGTSASNVVQMDPDAKLPAVDGSKLTNLSASQVSGLTGFMPTGAVIAMACETAPSGFLECDGAAVSRTTHAALFAVIGTLHGSGDNATTFNLPDYRGRFLRGWDHGIARDPDKASRAAMNTGGAGGDRVGSVQADAFKSHNHEVGALISGGAYNVQAYNASSGGLHNWFTLNNGGNETRPINAGVMYCIKC